MNTWVRCLLLIKMAVIGAPEVKYFKSVSCIFFPKSLISNDLFLFTIFFHSPNINVCTFFSPFYDFFHLVMLPGAIHLHSFFYIMYFFSTLFSLFILFSLCWLHIQTSFFIVHSFFLYQICSFFFNTFLLFNLS